GDLRQYICNNMTTLSWIDRLFIIWDISLDLERIHKAGLIHRDIHPGNILHTREVDHLLCEIPIHTGVAYIADFGLSMASSISHRSTLKVYGVMPYIAPEVLRGEDLQRITPTTLPKYIAFLPSVNAKLLG
ncbi:3156_t:CDS:2, partial [Racocetra fulgida]